MERSEPLNPVESQGPAITEAFYWLQTTPEFYDGQVEGDEDRAIEIGNIYSFALNEGLSVEEVDSLYEASLTD